MKTTIYITFNGADNNYTFDMDLETTIQKWNNQVNAVGFFSAHDEKGRLIVITPSNCGTVEIIGVK